MKHLTITRYLHFVGTMPQFADARKALTWQLDEPPGWLRRLSGGETGPRLLWIAALIDDIAQLPQIRTVHSGKWTSYDDVARLAVRRGARLTAADIPIRLAEHALEELDVLRDIGSPATTRLPLQIGVPSHLDLALFTFGPLGVFRHRRPFLHAIAGQVADIHAPAGDRVVYQLETATALIAVTATPPPLRPAMAQLIARLITRTVAAAPHGSRFGVHLCLGDLGHRALRQLPTADPVVRLANAIARQWPHGRQLEYMHLPMSGGNQPPTTDPAFYTPLRGLRVGTRVVAGIAHEDQDRTTQLTVRAFVEQALGTTVDIATSCGLGRRTPEQAEQAVATMQTLLTD
jgi:hypothetical protein